MARPKKSTEHDPIKNQKERFLAALAESGNITSSAASAGVPRRNVYNWRHEDEVFAVGWDNALDLGVDSLEDEATRRAKDGTLKPVFQGGVQVGEIREFSDTLMIFLLKGRRPEKYKDRHELTGKDGKPIEHDVTHTGTVTIAGRIAEFTDAFTRATDREEEGGIPSDGPRKSMDS